MLSLVVLTHSLLRLSSALTINLTPVQEVQVGGGGGDGSEGGTWRGEGEGDVLLTEDL